MKDLREAIELARKEGIQVADNGRLLCPFHDDHTPSAYLYYNTYHGQVEFHCFGCNRSYKFETFLGLLGKNPNAMAEVEKEKKEEAKRGYSLDYIAERLHQRFLALLSGAGDDEERALAWEGLLYLQGRGFDVEDIKRVGIGFILRGELEQIKEIEDNGWVKDTARKCFLSYPVRNREGEVVNIQFEDFLNRGKMEQTKLNIKGRPIPLCFIQELTPDTPYVVVEGYLDALSIEKFKDEIGVGAVALLGAPSKQKLEDLRKLAKDVEDVILALDNDETGRNFQFEVARDLAVVNPYVRVAEYPEGIKDANELLQKQGKRGIFELLLRSEKYVPVGKLDERCRNLIEKFKVAKENAFPIPASMIYLSELFKDGFLPGLYGVAGVPEVGKTTFLNMLCDELAKIGYKSIYLLTEEPEYRVVLRTIIKEGKKKFEELAQIPWAKNRMLFELTSEYTVEVLRRVLEGILAREGKMMIVLDSLHALRVENNGLDTREKTILKVEILSHMARDLFIPVFFTSFIPKSLYKDEPSIGVFKEAGEIEYLIDVGMVLTRDLEKGESLAWKMEKIPVVLTVVKNRFGSGGEVRLVLDKTRCSFELRKQ